MDSAEVLSWLQGFAGMDGFRFVRLPAGSKGTSRKWSAYADQVGAKGFTSACRWLKAGAGVGILPVPPNVCLDADCPEEVARIEAEHKRLGLTPARVDTPGGGAHFWIHLPDSFPLDNLKNHCRPKDEHGNKIIMDCKFGPKTLVVGPGTFNASKGKRYVPVAPWPGAFPEIDPRALYPGFSFWHPAEKPKQPKPPEKANPGGVQTDDLPFTVYSRSHANALRAGAAFLRSKKRGASVSGRCGRRTLAYVAEYLVGWLCLSPAEAVDLLTSGENSWNSRCCHKDRTPYPWTKTELLSYMRAAVGRGSAVGRREYARLDAARAARDELRTLVSILKAALVPGIELGLPESRVQRLFRWMGLPDLTATALGIEFRRQKILTCLATRKKTTHIPELAYRSLVDSILAARLKVGCPLSPTITPPTSAISSPKRSTNPLHVRLRCIALLGGEGFSDGNSTETRASTENVLNITGAA